MPSAENAVEAAIYKLGGQIFAKIVNPLIILFVVLAIVLFLWIVFKSIIELRSGSPSYKKLLWPVVGLTIMLSAIGITYFVGNTGNEIFQAGKGGAATKGIREVLQPINIR